MEFGKEISLADWARKNGINPSTARHKAGKGGFKTARKIGRDWVINENEPKIDGRRKSRNRNYFKNLDTEKRDLLLCDLELVIPEGFCKELNSMEKELLLNDQLLDYGLQVGGYMTGFSKNVPSLQIIPANKEKKHIEYDYQISSRLKEYLEKFNNM